MSLVERLSWVVFETETFQSWIQSLNPLCRSPHIRQNLSNFWDEKCSFKLIASLKCFLIFLIWLSAPIISTPHYWIRKYSEMAWIVTILFFFFFFWVMIILISIKFKCFQNIIETLIHCKEFTAPKSRELWGDKPRCCFYLHNFWFFYVTWLKAKINREN